MKITQKPLLLSVALVGALTMCGLTAQMFAQESRYEKLANASFPGGYPAKEPVEPLKNELFFQQAARKPMSGPFPRSTCGR